MIDIGHNASNTPNCYTAPNNITRHYKPIPVLTSKQLARFWRYVDRRGPDECWPWTGAVTRGKNGGSAYGFFTVLGRGFRPHRITYTLLVGPIPDGHTLNHLRDREGHGACTTTLCCNPAHTEPVTQSVNTKRYRASLPRICKRGHRMPERGNCGQCVRTMSAAWKARNRKSQKEHAA